MNKKIISTSVVLSLLLIGCGTDSSTKQEWSVSQNLDNGNYQAVIDALGDCSAKTGDAKDECYTNLGAAYFGLSKFDIISLGQQLLGVEDDVKKENTNYNSLSSSQQDELKDDKFNEIIFEKLLDKNTKKGTEAFDNVLSTDKSNCTEANYSTLNKTRKNACLSISPILLKDSLEDDKNNTSPKSTNTATLTDVIEFADVLKNAAPEVDGSKLATIVNDKTPNNADDLNSNGEIDIVEATRCVLEAYNASPINTSICSGVTISSLSTNVFATANGTTYDNIDSAIVTINSTNFYRLLKHVDTNNDTVTDTYTTISVDTTTKVLGDLTETSNSVNGTSVFYKPTVTQDSNNNDVVGTLNDTVTNVLNDENKLKTIALLTSSEDDNKTDDQKVDEFKSEICDTTISGTLTANTTYGNCTTDGTGKLVIPQDAVIKYMDKN